MKKTRYLSKEERNYWLSRCAELGIEIRENATKKQFKDALRAYFKDPSVTIVRTKSGLERRKQDSPSAEYIVVFNLEITQIVRAESEEAAVEWLEGLDYEEHYTPIYGRVQDVCGFQLLKVFKEGDEY